MDRGYDEARLSDTRGLIDAPDSDLFDVLGYVLFTNESKTRHARAQQAKSDGLSDSTTETRELLLAILKSYEERGESELATKKLGTFMTARYGSVSEGKAKLGGLTTVKEAFLKMQERLYLD